MRHRRPKNKRLGNGRVGKAGNHTNGEIMMKAAEDARLKARIRKYSRPCDQHNLKY